MRGTIRLAMRGSTRYCERTCRREAYYRIGAKVGDDPSCSLSNTGLAFNSEGEMAKILRAHSGRSDPTELIPPQGVDADRQENASCFASGDQEGCSHDQLESVVIWRTPEPFAF